MTPTKNRKQWIKKLDKLLKEACFARDKKCLKCGRTDGLNTAHIYSKGRHTKMRWDLDNVIALCWRCHIPWSHHEPKEFSDWLDATLDEKRLARLKLRAQITDRSPWDYEAVALYLKASLKKAQEV